MKKLFALLLVVVLTLTMFVGCAKTDWTTYTSYASYGEEEWAKKKIAYQFNTPEYEGRTALLNVNLFKDGSLVVYEACTFQSPWNNWDPAQQEFAIREYQIKNLYVGYWTELEDGTLELKVFMWPDDEGEDAYMVYTVKPDANGAGEIAEFGYCALTARYTQYQKVVSEGGVKYANLEAFYDWYKNYDVADYYKQMMGGN